WPVEQNNALNDILARALPYLDARLREDYDYLVRYKADLKQNHLSSTAVQYLYMHSFFSERKISPASETAYNYYFKQAQTYWNSQGKYEEGMIALALYRSNEQAVAKNILKSLTENSISNEEFGMYWKE